MSLKLEVIYVLYTDFKAFANFVVHVISFKRLQIIKKLEWYLFKIIFFVSDEIRWMKKVTVSLIRLKLNAFAFSLLAPSS